MKKVLLSTSAIALAGAVAMPASAAEWDVRVGGYYNAMVAYATTDLPAGDTRDFDGVDVSTNTEIFFLPKITLDNGIQIGANIQLEGETSGDTIDESYVQIKGSFGELNIGSENSAGYKMTYAAPNAAIISLNSPSTGDYIAWTGGVDSVFRGTLGTTYLEVQGNNDAKRITYYTPRMAGFQLGLSYAHDAAQDNFGPTDTSAALGDIFDVGANYVNTLGGIDIAVSARYGIGNNQAVATNDTPTVWSVGANLGFGGFTIGGSFAESNEHNAGVDDGTAYDIGVSYATGPWTFSATYFHGENGEAGGLQDEQDTFGLGINYQLAKGVRLNGFGAYVDADGAAAANDISGFVVGTGIGLSF
ncbi:MAG: porin [Pseudomonadota bacterium]